MGYSKTSKSNNGMQRRLFEKRGMRRKYYKKICKALKEMFISEENIDLVIAAVQSGDVQLGNSDLEKDIITLGKIDKEIQILERKLNSNASSANESGMSM